MKLTTAILAASLFMYVGVRNGTGERSSKDSLPRVDKFIGLVIGNWNHSYKRSHLSETMTGWRNADTVFECVIHSDNKILATRDTTGKWKVYNASKALEMFYQSHMEMFNRVYPEPKEPEFHIQLNAKPSPSPNPDSIPVIKVKQYQLFRDWCSSVEYRDDAGNSYIVHCLTQIVYNKHPASSGKKASELKVRLDTGGVVMTVNEPNYPRFPAPLPLPDTIPKYRYIFKLELGAEMLDRILYVQDSLMTHWGVEKGTTESNNAKLLYFNYSNYIRRSLKLDSVKIEQPKGGKP